MVHGAPAYPGSFFSRPFYQNVLWLNVEPKNYPDGHLGPFMNPLNPREVLYNTKPTILTPDKKKSCSRAYILSFRENNLIHLFYVELFIKMTKNQFQASDSPHLKRPTCEKGGQFKKRYRT
jgi:hypothetical protein